MISPVAERIYNEIKLLTRQKDELSNQMTKLRHAIDHVKHEMHHTEWLVVSESAPEDLDHTPDARLGRELRELYKERKDLHEDEKILKDLTQKYDVLVKKIDTYRFWMRRADTSDPVRQREAEKKIFG
jgi:hypothetical protein